jgi:hypothetical protein
MQNTQTQAEQPNSQLIFKARTSQIQSKCTSHLNITYCSSVYNDNRKCYIEKYYRLLEYDNMLFGYLLRTVWRSLLPPYVGQSKKGSGPNS